MGGMLHYDGEWYWGIDRLPYLEQALARDFGSDVAHVVTPRAETERAPQKIADVPEGKQPKPLTCEMWFSFRSPYSYLALEQIEAVLAPYNVPLELRPILPMVDARRAAAERQAHVHRARREARSRSPAASRSARSAIRSAPASTLHRDRVLGARSAAQLLAFAKSAMRGIWSEARDMAEYVDLKLRRRARRPALGRGQRGARQRPRRPQWANDTRRPIWRCSGCGAYRRSRSEISWRGARIGCRCSPTACAATRSRKFLRERGVARVLSEAVAMTDAEMQRTMTRSSTSSMRVCPPIRVCPRSACSCSSPATCSPRTSR